MHTFRKFAPAAAAMATALLMTACAASKSSNPLSPEVAGPIPGINISAPRVMVPSVGAKIAVDGQPVTLTVGNASTNGVRPLSYAFQVATDVNFSSLVFTRDSIAPGDSGQTSLRLPDPLATGRTYYWRAMAQDGANTGPFSPAANFDVFTPIVINAPVLVAPVSVTADSLHPKFVFNNAVRTGPAGAITYVIEIADNDAFANKFAIWTIAEQAGQTSLTAPQDLPASKQFFWHVKATDPTTSGPFSPTASFQTPAPVVIAPPAGSAPSVPSGPAPNDSIDMRQASIWNSPTDLANWAVTTKITSVVFTPSAFLVDFDRRTGSGRWPDVGFGDGNLEYTLGMCLSSNGHWDCSAVVQFWFGRDLGASAAPSEIATAWFYDGRWGPLTGRQPADGETVGIFVCAGNCRNNTAGDGSIVHERSNVQFVTWSNHGGGSFSFSAGSRMSGAFGF